MQANEMEALGLNLSGNIASNSTCMLEFDMPMASISSSSTLLALPGMQSTSSAQFPVTTTMSHVMSSGGMPMPSDLSHVDPLHLQNARAPSNCTTLHCGNRSNAALRQMQLHSQMQHAQAAQVQAALQDNEDDMVSSAPRFQCPVCSKALSSNWYRKIHMRVHTGEGLLPCQHCGKKFPSEARLAVHLRVHTGEKPFPCEICEKKFAQKGTLNAHMRVHTGEKPFVCEVCGKGFSRRQRHAAHVSTHVKNVQLVPCPFCSRRLPSNKSLQRHMGVHTGERPFACEVCGEAFVTSQDLDIHARSHARERRFICKVCGKSLSSSWYVRVHMRSHTGEGMMSCGDCGKLFPSSSRLKAHRRIHTGEKPFACDRCGKGYSRRTRLLSHIHQHEESDRLRCKDEKVSVKVQ